MSRSKLRTYTRMQPEMKDEEDENLSVFDMNVAPESSFFPDDERKRRSSPLQHIPGWSPLCGNDNANVKALVLMAFLTFVLVRMNHASQSSPQQLRAAYPQPVMAHPPPGYVQANLPPGFYFYPGTAISAAAEGSRPSSPLVASQGNVPQATQHVPEQLQQKVEERDTNGNSVQERSQVTVTNLDKSTPGATDTLTGIDTSATPIQTTIAAGSTGATLPAKDGSAHENQPVVQQPFTVVMSQLPDFATVAARAQGERPLSSQPVQQQQEGEEATNANAIPLVDELQEFKDSWDPFEPSDTAVFWHIPKAGGSTVKDVLGSCHRHVLASEFGVTDGHHQDTQIAVVYPRIGGEVGTDRSPFVNVDTTTVEGIERAKQMGFAESGLADLVVTPFIYQANALFTPTAKGRLFSVFRHPIDRAVSMFYYLQIATWEPTYKPELQQWTLEQYATSDIVENNWMCRQLANALTGDLNDNHLAIAMEVVRRKFLVGLMTNIEASMERFEKFFRWKYRVNPTTQEKCREQLLTGGSNKNAKKKEKPEPGSRAWELLAHQNNYDLRLYQYIERLFQEQEAFVSHLPDGYRLVGSTCCKCSPPTYPPEGFECPKAVLN